MWERLKAMPKALWVGVILAILAVWYFTRQSNSGGVTVGGTSADPGSDAGTAAAIAAQSAALQQQLGTILQSNQALGAWLQEHWTNGAVGNGSGGTTTGGSGGTTTGGTVSSIFNVLGYTTPVGQEGQGKDVRSWSWDAGAQKFVRWDTTGGGLKQLLPAQFVTHFGALPTGYNWSKIITRSDRLAGLSKVGYSLPTSGKTIIGSVQGNILQETGSSPITQIDVSKSGWWETLHTGGNVT